MPPNLVINEKPCGGPMLACFISCVASAAAFRSDYSLDVENETKDVLASFFFFFFHFITSCASVEATDVTVSCNKAPDRGC